MSRDSFRQEIEALGRLNHRGIVTIFHADEAEGRPFFAMELVNGKNLKFKHAESLPLKGDDAAPLIEELAEVVDYAHKQNVLHLDLKPSNILVDEEGT